MAILALAGCAGPSATPGNPSASPSPSPDATAQASATSAASASPVASEVATASPVASATPVPSPTAGPGATVGPGAACFGKPAQQQFFEAIAGAVPWDVYCAVLPAGWSVEGGTWHLADGGRMQISYKGPAGARFELQEGSFCTAGLSACEPHDQILGSAAFGDRQGGLMTLGPDMGFALYVDPGQEPAWQATGVGLDQSTFVSLCAALAKVGG